MKTKTGKTYAIQTFVLLFGMCFIVKQGIGQNKDSSFDNAFNKIIQLVVTDSLEKIQVSLDSLIKKSVNDIQRSKTTLFKAIINIHSGNKVDALHYGIEAERLAIKAKSNEWQIRSAGFLSALYREVGLVREGLKHIEIAERANANFKHHREYNLFQTNIIGERAHYESATGNYEKAINLLIERSSFIDPLGENTKPSFQFGNFKLMGENYLQLQKYDLAEQNFKMALDLVENKNVKDVGELSVYRGLGEVELHKKNYSDALSYLKKAESYLSFYDNIETKILVYKSLYDYYVAIDNIDDAFRYNKLYVKNINDRKILTEEIFNQLIQKSDDDLLMSQYKMEYLIVFSSLAMVLILALVIKLRAVRYSTMLKYMGLKNKVNSVTPDYHKQDSVRQKELFTDYKPKKAAMIPKQTEQRILKDLEALEKDFFFIEKDISLATLALKLDTNIKYLSNVINTRKNKDYNNYINELRVDYIINKLHEDPQYLHYKLAYIADEAGFSSHSKFTAIFKRIKGISPSEFISQLKNND